MSIQPGRYLGIIKNATIGESTNTKTPGVFLEIKTHETGDTVEATLWLSEKAIERNVNVLRECIGFDGDFSTIAKQAIGREVSIVVEMELADNGKEYPRVKWVNPPKKERPSAGSDLIARLTAQAKRIPKPAGLVMPTAAPSTEAQDDGDGPF